MPSAIPSAHRPRLISFRFSRTLEDPVYRTVDPPEPLKSLQRNRPHPSTRLSAVPPFLSLCPVHIYCVHCLAVISSILTIPLLTFTSCIVCIDCLLDERRHFGLTNENLLLLSHRSNLMHSIQSCNPIVSFHFVRLSRRSMLRST